MTPLMKPLFPNKRLSGAIKIGQYWERSLRDTVATISFDPQPVALYISLDTYNKLFLVHLLNDIN